MPIDNQWYDELEDRWWDRAGPMRALHDMNPARFDYFREALGHLAGLRVLEVGCGGGILTESFARAGARACGVDLSERSVAAARRHSQSLDLKIDYLCARGEQLPFAASSFDAVVSADFLEHVSDLNRVVGECSRVIRPGGFFLYDTINRTLRSRLIVVWLLERALGLIPRHTHDPRLFIKPAHLHRVMARHSLTNCETRGLVPKAGPLRGLVSLVKHGSGGAFKVAGDTSISYVGYGVKDRSNDAHTNANI
jgi:2-polyprenyl-6-hydroxyphenyl methylase / 3-demethylubiquinone-9 3-methyltransferase